MKKIIRATAVLLVILLTAGTFAACSLQPQSKQLVAKWTDSNNLSGYTFHEDGTVNITYINFTVPIVNMPFNGTVDGSYTTEKVDGVNYVTLNYTIWSKTIQKKYQYCIENSVLTLTDPDNGSQTVYIKGNSEASSST
ncbi:MAG: hypothetical protein ACI4GA_01800 [Acutalibacteraceae bacterium]|nr:hypothetical protein [Oscillospiraceae bacterium]